jgi:hypothetical protein
LNAFVVEKHRSSTDERHDDQYRLATNGEFGSMDVSGAQVEHLT